MTSADESPPTSPTTVEIRPNPGRQEQYLSSGADVAIFGGGAGGGKTWASMYEPLRHIHVPRFGALILRETRDEIRQVGGMWEESQELYPLFNGIGREGPLDWTFYTEEGKAPAVVKFDGIQYDKDLKAYQGGQIPLIVFDQLEHFTERKFWYMFTRNRSTCGVRPYIRATCNPVPADDPVGGWLNRLLAWWIDPETGYAVDERAGVIRWLIRVKGQIVWGSSRDELLAKHPSSKPKSFTFVPALLKDNPKMSEKDPDYEGNLAAQTIVDEERLRFGNWKIRPAAGLYAKREWFKVVDAAPAGAQWVRGWDFAATKKTADGAAQGPPKTVGVKLGKLPDGRFIVGHVVMMQEDPYTVRESVKNLASQDGAACRIDMPQDPGQAGKDQVQEYARMLAGYNVTSSPETGDKVTRFGAFSAQARAGNVLLLKGEWNEAYLTALEQFPTAGLDEGDASSRAMKALTDVNTAALEALRNEIAAHERREASGNDIDRRPPPS